MLHVRPSKELRNNYSKISELVRKGDRVIITVNGVGDGVLISMEAFNEYEMLRTAQSVMTQQERLELTQNLKKCLEYSDDPASKFFTHQEAGEMLGLNKV